MRSRKLGQHFIDDVSTLMKMVSLAEINQNDRVIEIGAGRGSLTMELCRTKANVVSFEIDRDLFSELKDSFNGVSNLQLINADAFESDPEFDVLVANLPYSRSEEFVEWLATKIFRRAVVMLQTDFVDKLLSLSGRTYRAVSVIAQHAFSIRKVAEVPKALFKPPPKVSSTIIIIERKNIKLTKSDLQKVKYLWSFRGKTLSSAVKAIARKKKVNKVNISTLINSRKRIAELSPEEAFRVAKAIEQA